MHLASGTIRTKMSVRYCGTAQDFSCTRPLSQRYWTRPRGSTHFARPRRLFLRETTPTQQRRGARGVSRRSAFRLHPCFNSSGCGHRGGSRHHMLVFSSCVIVRQALDLETPRHNTAACMENECGPRELLFCAPEMTEQEVRCLGIARMFIENRDRTDLRACVRHACGVVESCAEPNRILCAQ